MKSNLKKIIFLIFFPIIFIFRKKQKSIDESKILVESKQRLEENKQFMRNVIDSIPLLVSVKDYDGNYILVNKSLADIFNTTVDDMEGKKDIDFINGIMSIEDGKKYKAVDREVINTQTEKHIPEEKVIDRNGNVVYFQTTKYPLTIRGKANYVMGVSSNITKSKLDAEELKNANAGLEDFASIASHDLQEPLRVVSSYCQLLKSSYYDSFDEEGKKYLDYMVDSSLRMKILIKELLDYSRVGRRDKPFEKIKLEELLEEVLYDFEFRIKETDANIIIENNLPEIFAIRFRIKQLLHNIISNSLKFINKKKPIIRIGFYEKYSNLWYFYIKDNGIGMEQKDYDLVFGVFKRLYSREEYPGTGIGLALCKKIVETHGGNIWIESEINKGSCIHFTISKAWDVFND